MIIRPQEVYTKIKIIKNFFIKGNGKMDYRMDLGNMFILQEGFMKEI
jgi:hypothetical protein